MRKSIWVNLLMLVICMSFAVEAGAQKHEFANYKRFAKANSELPKVTKKDKRVVFMGNSITDNWARYDVEFFEKNN